MDISLLPIAYLIPIGLVLASWGSLPASRWRESAVAAIVIVLASTVAYIGFGFALQFGGVGLSATAPAGLSGLDKAWSPFPAGAGSWSFAGLEGFFVNAAGSASSLTLAEPLALHRLPLAMTAGLIPVVALGDRAHRVARISAGIVASAIVYPLAGAWIWGGGWLATLGTNLNLGHGAIDAAGSGIVYLASACVAFIAQRLFEGPKPGIDPALPDLHQPWLALTGAALFGIGSAAWSLSDPLLSTHTSIRFEGVATIGLVSAATATLTAGAYLWLATGRIRVLSLVRGWIAGWVSAGASALFIPPAGAMAVGLVAGLLSVMGSYVAEATWRVDDRAGVMGSLGAAGAWGLIALGLFADGAFGSGWNGAGVASGVRGLLASDAGQLSAQLNALVAIGTWATVASALLLLPAALVIQRLGSRAPSIVPAQEVPALTPPVSSADSE